MTNKDLTLSFAKLQQEASCVEDMYAWFSENKEALVGDLKFPDNAEYKIHVAIDTTNMLRDAISDDCIEASMDITVTYLVEHGLPIVTLFANPKYENSIEFKQTSYMSMPLAEWPLACAMAAEMFVAERRYCEDFGPYTALGEVLDKDLRTYFPGWSLDRLVSLAEADVIPKDENNHQVSGYIRDMLFATRTARQQVTLPTSFGQSM